MSRGLLHALVGRLREGLRPGAGLSDAELLQRWSAGRDEAAFELLVWRHGPLVLSVCRRWLRQTQDVEDAFQATFLVLIKKAGSISRRQALASWLHTVACRVAREARSRRRDVSGVMPEQVIARAGPEPGADEERAVLDEEVARLPEKYRTAFVLCCLEGRTNDEAARALGLPVGTVQSRLSRARERLRARLTRRGITPSPGLLVPVGVPPVASALVGKTIATATVVALKPATVGASAGPAVALMEGALYAMFMTKLKAATVALAAVVLLGVGGGLAGLQGFASSEGDRPGATTGGDPRARELAELRQQLSAATFLVDVLRRRIEQLEKGPRTPPTKPASPLSEDALAKIEDDLAILEAKVEASKADLEGSRGMLFEAERRYDAIKRLKATGKGGVVSANDEGLARASVQRYHAEVASKQALLKIPMVELERARRRAEALKKDRPGAATTPGRTLEERVRDLEQRLDRLEKAGRGPGTSPYQAK